MKRTAAILAITAISATAFAQGNKLQSAINYLRYNELDNARDAIDLAAEHESTSGQAKTWWYKGKIYLEIFQTKEDKFKSLHPDPLKIAAESFLMAKTLDVKRIDENDLDQNMKRVAYLMEGKGIELYQNKKFDESLAAFEQLIELNRSLGRPDTLAAYNTGLAAYQAGDMEKAEKWFLLCAETGKEGANAYANLANVYRKMEKEEKATEIIQQGIQKYPNDQNLITDMINIHLKNDNHEAALASLDKAIANDSKNPTLYYARGTIHNNQKQNDKARADYAKALEINPEYFDALYNLGALYFNEGAEIINEANALPLNQAAKGEELKKKATEKFTAALPHLEKAHQLNPADKPTMESLKSIYARTGQTDKYNEMKEKLSN